MKLQQRPEGILNTRGICIILICLFSFLAGTAFTQPRGVGADGKTLEDRKRDWLNQVPGPSGSIDENDRYNYLFSWLDSGIYNGTVSETIEDFINGYWLDDIRAQHAYAAMIIMKYGSKGTGIISPENEERIKDKYRDWITSGDVFGDLNPNKGLLAMVGVYLYTSIYDKGLEFKIYGYSTRIEGSVPNYYRSHWPSIDYNGRSYDFGDGPYNARQLAKDWIEWAMDGWFVRKSRPQGNREFDAIVYSRAYPIAMALLQTLADDPVIRRKAQMCADLVNLDSVLDFSANAWGGTMGRCDYRKNARSPIYPFHHYWGMGDVLDGQENKWNITALYHLDYRPTDVVIDAGVLTDEPDDYWHFHKEYNEGLLNDEGMGKWNWVTKFYNLGSNVGQQQQGWQLSVKGRGRTGFIRLWVNNSGTEPDDKQETNYLGSGGRQFRNALFADVGGGPKLWEQTNEAGWEISDSEGGWEFRKLDRVMVAVGLGDRSASVEVAISGIDYADFSAFKSVIKQHAVLTDDSYTTSRGIKIGKRDYCGLNRPGDVSFPFPRMETIDYLGNKIVSWENNVMKVTRHGNSVTYDFNNWTYSEKDSPVDTDPPDVPTGITAEVVGN